AVDRGPPDDGSAHARDAGGVPGGDGSSAGAGEAVSEPLIRSAGPGDGVALARLIGQLEYEVTPDEVAERLVAMEAEGRLALVAVLEGEGMACLSTSIMRVLHRPAPVGRISMMVVDERVRNRGIGAALVRAAERLLA